MNAFSHRFAAVSVVSVLSCALCASAFAARPAAARACKAQVVDGWVRLPPNAMPMMAGFARIENGCATPVAIVAARSDAFASVELHETRVVDGVSRMRPVPALRIPAKGGAQLKPGGMHLMLMRPSAALSPGGTVAVEFELAGGGVLRGDFEVRATAP